MTPLDVTTILGNKTQPWFHVCQLNLERSDARSFFQVGPVVADEPRLGDADYWAVQFDCSLKICFEFFHSSDASNVYADLPCPQHVRRHLRHWNTNLFDLPAEVTERDRAEMIDRFAVEIPALHELTKYQVWRQGDDGNEMPVGCPTTKRDADCWIRELESHGHKQIYWSSHS